MPIVKDYQPAAALVGQAAYQAGLGNHNKYQQQMDLQNRQLNQQRDLTLFGAGAQQQSQYLDINAAMQQQANALANSQWNTMAGVAGQSFLNQQQNQYNMASQVYGAGVNAALQTQSLQTNADLQFQKQMNDNQQLIMQLQQQAAGQQYAAAVDLGMQTQRLATGLVQQQIGIGADTDQQNRGIVASAMQQQEGISADARQQDKAISAQRQNALDQLASQNWTTQYGAAIDQQNLAAQMENQQWLQQQDITAEKIRQQTAIDASFRQQVNSIQAQKDMQIQAQQVEAVFRNQDVAVQQQNLLTQIESQRQNQIFNAYIQQQSQYAQQMANERMSVWEQGNANYRQGQSIAAQNYGNTQSQQYDIYKTQQLHAYDVEMQQQGINQANQATTQEAEARKKQQMFQYQSQIMDTYKAVSSGLLRPEEASMIVETLNNQMGILDAEVPDFQQPSLTQQWEAGKVPLNKEGTKFAFRQGNGWEVYEPPQTKDNSFEQNLKTQQFEFQKNNALATQTSSLAQLYMNQTSTDGTNPVSPQAAYERAAWETGYAKVQRQQDLNLLKQDMEQLRTTVGTSNPVVLEAAKEFERLTIKSLGLRNKQNDLSLPDAELLMKTTEILEPYVGN
jgi:hypothetical protein